MEEQNQNFEQETQNHNPILQEKTAQNNRWLIIVAALFLTLVAGGVFWWLQKDDIKQENLVVNEFNVNTINDNETLKEDTFIDNDLESDSEDILLMSLSEQCNRANGIWENGKCKAQDCFDMDATLGEYSKYVSSDIYYNGDKDIFSDAHDEYIIFGNRQGDVCNDSIMKEAICSSEINILEDFKNSYIEYECEEGCDGKIERCKKLDYDLSGKKIRTLILDSYIGDHAYSSSYKAYVGANGVVSYEWGNYGPGAAILSEDKYTEIYKNIMNMDNLFIEVLEGDDPYGFEEDTDHFSVEDRENNGYMLSYSYYSEGQKEDFENLKFKKFACNINCPNEIINFYNEFQKFTPYFTESNKHWVPQFIYDNFKYGDKCGTTDVDLACWYNIVATERPDTILGDYNKDNIFFVNINYSTDSDNDGIPDFNEKYLGMDIYSADTDTDGYQDLAELESGYNPAGEGAIDYSFNELFSILETQCSEIGGTMDSLDSPNANCWGIELEENCSEAFNCLWVDYGYCKPEMYYCVCDDNQKIYPIMMHSFIGSCD